MRKLIIISLFYMVFSFMIVSQPAFSSQGVIHKQAMLEKIGKIQIPFIENTGQISNEAVRFYAKTFWGTVFVTEKGEIVYSLPDDTAINKLQEVKSITDRRYLLKPQKQVRGVTLKEEFIGSNVTSVTGQEKAETQVSYFRGNDPSKWHRAISTHNVVTLGEIYKGIELSLRAYGNNTEKLFTIKPSATPQDIRIAVKGSKGMKVNSNGELAIATELGLVTFTKPVAYQEEEQGGECGSTDRKCSGKRNYIEVSYEVLPSTTSSVYSFKLGAYDTKKNLFIDPLLASTFLGGSDFEYSHALAIDSLGNVFVTGETMSSNFPTTTGAYDTSHGFADFFIAKLDSSLNSLLATTFLGGSDFEAGEALAIDTSGNVYVTGFTGSSDYPVTPGAYDTTHNGVDDIFVSKLDSSLSSLLASTFIGGYDGESGSSLATDSSGNIYVAGGSSSSDYPVTVGAYDTTWNGGSSDTFVSKLDSRLSLLLASTFLGGSEWEWSSALAIDSSGNVYVTGGSHSLDYPLTTGAYDTTPNGWTDVFVSKLNSSLSALLASTFLGGSDGQSGQALAIDVSGNVYAAGLTESPDYPVTVGAYDTTWNGGSSDPFSPKSDVFVSKLNSSLSSLLASTFLGGIAADAGEALTIDSSGNVYVTGFTDSPDYPTTIFAYDTSWNGSIDVFVSKLDSSLSSLLASTFLGGSEVDSSGYKRHGLAIDSSGNVYVMSDSPSSDYPTTAGAYDTSWNGSRDIVVSKLDSNLLLDSLSNIFVSPTSHDFGSVNVGNISAPQVFTITNTDIEGLVINQISLTGTDPTEFSIPDDNCSGQTLMLLANCTIKVLFFPKSDGPQNATLSIPSNDPITPTLNVQLNGIGTMGNPIISVSSRAVSFGSVRVGSTSVKPVTIKNTGIGYLTVNSITIMGTNEFSQSDECQIVPPGSSCTFNITFTPTLPYGKKNAVMTIASNDPKKATVNVKLSGHAPPPKISASPMSVNFAPIPVGTTSLPKIVTIKNTGISDLVIDSISITGANASEFKQTYDCTTIQAKGSCTVSVTFMPTLPYGKKSAVMTIASNDPKKPTVNVKLSGQAPPPKITVSHTSVNFGSVRVGVISDPKIVTIKNTGTSDLIVDKITTTGTYPVAFSQTNNCTAVVKGGSCAIIITFGPTSVGGKSAELNISSNNPQKSTYIVKLSGKGTQTGTSIASYNVSVATGVDDGPQDGIFDSFTISNLGSVVNDGFTSFRTAFEFSLSALPMGSTINSANLTMVLYNYEGTRSIEVHGYTGDGTVQLSDLALNGQLGTVSVAPNGVQTLFFDVTRFIADLVSKGGTFAGFNVREEPANTLNFVIMQLALSGVPVLSIDFSMGQTVAIDVKSGSFFVSIGKEFISTRYPR